MGDKNGKPIWWHIADCFVFLLIVGGLLLVGSELVILVWEMLHG